ncbi:hypothetical protein [Streptomyces sp. NPDC055287]
MGDQGGKLQFSGPVGRGVVLIEPTGVPQTEVAGGMSVQIRHVF